jgi:type I restriction enzyme R subunit
LNEAQREFVSYVLRNYVTVGVDELDISRLSTVLTAKYGSLNAAAQELGEVAGIQETFISFQQHFYAEDVAFLKAVKLRGVNLARWLKEA